MRIERGLVQRVHHRLKTPIQTAHGELASRSGFRLELWADGCHATAETLPLPSAGTEDEDRCLRRLESTLPDLIHYPVEESPKEAPWWRDLDDAPAARFAVDVALLRLEAGFQGVSVPERLTSKPADRVASHALVAGPSPTACRDAAAKAIAAGFQVLKLKVGRAELTEDLRTLQSVCDGIPANIRLRLDANGAWSEGSALTAIESFLSFPVDCIEQPVAAHELQALADIAEQSPIAVAADESLSLEEGRAAFRAGQLTPLGVLKPMVLGGIRPALELAEVAASNGQRTFVTTTFDGPCGTTSAVELAACIPRDDVHGLATAEWMDGAFPDELIPKSGALRVAR